MGRTALCHGELGNHAGVLKAILESDIIQLHGDLRAGLSLTSLRDVRLDGDALRARTIDTTSAVK